MRAPPAERAPEAGVFEAEERDAERPFERHRGGLRNDRRRAFRQGPFEISERPAAKRDETAGKAGPLKPAHGVGKGVAIGVGENHRRLAERAGARVQDRPPAHPRGGCSMRATGRPSSRSTRTAKS